MPNIFELGYELQKVFEAIEENDGELTPELEEELNITQENFKDKIEAYCQALTIYTSDVDCCKEEKLRINNIQNVKKNNIERIKQRLLEAVELFGEIGKSGNKVIETPTRKLFTKGSTSIEENELRKIKLTQYVIDFIRELQQQGILELGEEIDINGFLASINAIAKADYETPDEFGNTPVEEFIPYTIYDLEVINVTCSFEKPLSALLTKNANLGYAIATNPFSFDINSSINKDGTKTLLKTDAKITVASESKKTSIVIK